MAKVSIDLAKIRLEQAEENLIDAKYLFEKIVILEKFENKFCRIIRKLIFFVVIKNETRLHFLVSFFTITIQF